jgi:hypothetical protein
LQTGAWLLERNQLEDQKKGARAVELRKFAEIWCGKDSKPKQVQEIDLRSVETRYAISFPEDYFSQVIAVGLPWAPTLLSAILDRDLNLHDLSGLCTPEEIVEETEGWRPIGMPDHLIVIGWDCTGNKFCFDIPELSEGVKPGTSVFFWDHDFNETTKIAESFSGWISSYIDPWEKIVFP